MTWLKDLITKYVLKRLFEPSSLLGYITAGMTWLATFAAANGYVLSPYQTDALTQWVLLTIGTVLVLLPEKAVTFIPSKFIEAFKPSLKGQ